MTSESLEQYIKSIHTDKTSVIYLFDIKKFLTANPRAKSYKYKDIIHWTEKLTSKYPNTSTRVRILSSIKKYYNYLLHTGYRCDHPCRKLTIKAKRGAIQVQDLFTREELELLYTRPNRYKHLDIRDKVVISLLLNLALTSAEIVNLNISNIDFDSGSIKIKGSAKIAGRELGLDVSQFNLIMKYINEVRPLMLKTRTNRLIITKAGTAISVDGINSIIVPLKMLFPEKTLNPRKIRMSVISYWLNDKKIPIEDVMTISGIKWASNVAAYKRNDIEKQRLLINQYHPLR